MYFTQVVKKCNDYSERAVEKKTPEKTVLRASIIFAVYGRESCGTFGVITLKS